MNKISHLINHQAMPFLMNGMVCSTLVRNERKLDIRPSKPFITSNVCTTYGIRSTKTILVCFCSKHYTLSIIATHYHLCSSLLWRPQDPSSNFEVDLYHEPAFFLYVVVLFSFLINTICILLFCWYYPA